MFGKRNTKSRVKPINSELQSIMGKGKDLFGHFNDLAKEKGPGSEESKYAGVLFQALLMLGERRTFELLEEADEKGKKLKLEYQSKTRKGSSNPSGVILA